ncbi:MAG: hypothetical protein AAF722_03510 [Cyanobacteria bacterium P01_C01_bin.70]
MARSQVGEFLVNLRTAAIAPRIGRCQQYRFSRGKGYGDRQKSPHVVSLPLSELAGDFLTLWLSSSRTMIPDGRVTVPDGCIPRVVMGGHELKFPESS